jgi:transcriptional regulator with XRE-family HTH domain
MRHISLWYIRFHASGKGAKIAQELGITRQSLSRKLNGHQPLRVEEINKIATYLGIDVDRFIADVDSGGV